MEILYQFSVFLIVINNMKKQKIPLDTFPLPSKYDIIGVIVRNLGNDRMLVKCQDGNERLCRIRGRMKRRVWIREGDIVLVSPWDFQSDIRGDIIWKYHKSQIKMLKKRRYLTIE